MESNKTETFLSTRFAQDVHYGGRPLSLAARKAEGYCFLAISSLDHYTYTMQKVYQNQNNQTTVQAAEAAQARHSAATPNRSNSNWETFQAGYCREILDASVLLHSQGHIF